MINNGISQAQLQCFIHSYEFLFAYEYFKSSTRINWFLYSDSRLGTGKYSSNSVLDIISTEAFRYALIHTGFIRNEPFNFSVIT
jgi:hypothetical protein